MYHYTAKLKQGTKITMRKTISDLFSHADFDFLNYKKSILLSALEAGDSYHAFREKLLKGREIWDNILKRKNSLV